MELHPVPFYARELKKHLPAETFRPALSRLLWLPTHLAVVVLGTLAIARRWTPWPVVPALSLVIGMSFGGLMFLGHETLHGAVVRGRWKWLRPIVGWICFAPFALSQRLWVVWHNRVHHANTNRPGADPDMYPTLAEYQASPVVRFATDNFALGGRRRRGVLSLLVGFVVQSKWILWNARALLHITRRDHLVAIAETVVAVALWATVAFLVGPVPFLLAFALPLVVADVIVMGFILTNHGLSPATEVNDPLINSLTVTAPRWLEWLTLDFGYHVEHHLFPSLSGRHGRAVRGAIRACWPERYQTMGVFSALQALHRTGRVYEDATTLVDPRSGGRWPTLAPRGVAATTPALPRSDERSAA